MAEPETRSALSNRPMGSEAAPLAATVAGAAMIAHQVGGKATRDTLFLSTFHVSRLPWVMVGSALLTILVTLAAARVLRRFGPTRVVPWAYLASAALHLGEWALIVAQRREWAAVALYLHMSIVPVLISGFWSILSEGVDPRANRRQMARAALASSFGGVLGGALAWSGGILVMLPLLAVLHIVCAGATRGLKSAALDGREPAKEPATDAEVSRALFGRGVLRAAPYLGYLAAGVTLFAASAALLEFVFKAQAQAGMPAQADLKRLFAVFYTSTSLLALIVQLSLSQWTLKKVGLVPTAGALPLSVTMGSALALWIPGLWSSAIARGSEIVMRNSLFRSAYEPLYTAVPASEKNASKTIVDVGFERVGDALGAGLALALIPLGTVPAARAQLLVAMALSIVGLWLARLIHTGYKDALRKNFESGAIPPLDSSQLMDTTAISISRERFKWMERADGPAADLESLEQQIAALRSYDPVAVRQVLGSGTTLAPALVAHVIPLLGRDEVAGPAIEALRRAAADNIGQLVDRLLDPGTNLAVRRRIPRTLEGCDSARAVDGLLDGLEDTRFEIRVQCGRSLARMRERNPEFHVDDERIRTLVLHEVEVERQVWETHQALEMPEEPVGSALVDERIRKRANRSLEHVFNLLALSSPGEPLRMAFRALNTSDPHLRGTALDYLEAVLPGAIRDKLWPFLEADQAGRTEPSTREAALTALMGAHESIEISLSELQRYLKSPDPPPAS